MAQESHESPFAWTRRQRRVLIGLLAIASLILLVAWAGNRSYVADPQPEHGARSAELADKLDPNDAPWESLAAIPSLGEGLAKLIVEYRERFAAERSGTRVPAYRSLKDLTRVKGIGDATAQTLAPHLRFAAADRPSTSP